jgi:hypothetical protein
VDEAERLRADTDAMDILEHLLGCICSCVADALDPQWIKSALDIQDIVCGRSEVPAGPTRVVFGTPADVVEFLSCRARYVIERPHCLNQRLSENKAHISPLVAYVCLAAC